MITFEQLCAAEASLKDSMVDEDAMDEEEIAEVVARQISNLGVDAHGVARYLAENVMPTARDHIDEMGPEYAVAVFWILGFSTAMQVQRSETLWPAS